ncbi:hypothetical protein C5O79_04820 [Burkholderia sp. SRS-25]|nr:hypothetical protein C5O79_04820 [Burkholderia sp. SRS-25]
MRCHRGTHDRCSTTDIPVARRIRGQPGWNFAPATENLYRTDNPLVQDIVMHRGEWRDRVPRR